MYGAAFMYVSCASGGDQDQLYQRLMDRMPAKLVLLLQLAVLCWALAVCWKGRTPCHAGQRRSLLKRNRVGRRAEKDASVRESQEHPASRLQHRDVDRCV
jgi:hypothetical protein